MPSCTSCDRYLSPPTVRADGTCPNCGHPVQVAHREGSEPPDEVLPFPWHFKLAVAALVIYLGWRAYEGVVWAMGRFGS
jgi:hypothetical protein